MAEQEGLGVTVFKRENWAASAQGEGQMLVNVYNARVPIGLPYV